MNKSVIFIQLSEGSYDECFLIDRMLSQIQGNVTSIVFSNAISSSFNSSNPEHIVGLLTEDQESNKERFDSALEMAENPVAIIVLDLCQYYLNPMTLNFLPMWLEKIELPILALDYFNLLEEKNDFIVLKSDVNPEKFEEGEGPNPIGLNIKLIKPLPPIYPEAEIQSKTFYWNALDKNFNASRPQLRKQVLDSIESNEEAKVILVAYDPTLLTQALNNNMISYYYILIEVLVFYLRQFPGQRFKILVVGSKPPTENKNEIPDINLEIHYFSHFTEDNYRALLAASDMIISNNHWSTLLLDAMDLGIPVSVMGNSIIQDWKDETETEHQTISYFSPDVILYNLSLLMMSLNRNSITTPIYQFINYPIKYLEQDFPKTGLQQKGLPYFLMDMFNDEDCITQFRELLFSKGHQEEYNTFCAQILEHAEQGLRMETILDQVKNEL